MSADGAGLTDEVSAELNPGLEPAPLDQPARIPDRPVDGAKKARWVAYVVALGLHPDEADRLTHDELIALAGRLGG